MFPQNQSQTNIESGDAGKKEKKSNLSETAQLVNGVMIEYIMPVLRESGLVAKANKIIGQKLTPDNPEVIEFSLACRERQSEINARAQKDGRNSKELAVISNYFSKLLNSVSTENIAEAPRATV